MRLSAHCARSVRGACPPCAAAGTEPGFGDAPVAIRASCAPFFLPELPGASRLRCPRHCPDSIVSAR